MILPGTKCGGASVSLSFSATAFLLGWLSSLLGCAPPEPDGRAVAAIGTTEAARGSVRRIALAPDLERARVADEAVRRFEATRPAVNITETPAASLPAGEHNAEGGIPQERFLAEPDLTLGSGLLVADVSFESPGVPDDFSLDRGGRFRVPTNRFRVRLHDLARRAGLPVPTDEFDLYAPRSFVPVGDGSGEAPRMLVVLGDQSLRPGLNLLIAAPLSSASGLLRARAFESSEGTSSIEVMRALHDRAARMPAADGTSGGAS